MPAVDLYQIDSECIFRGETLILVHPKVFQALCLIMQHGKTPIVRNMGHAITINRVIYAGQYASRRTVKYVGCAPHKLLFCIRLEDGWRESMHAR